jgi:hypothetical protein
MKKHILGLALLAVFAFSAVLSASASAEITLLAEWLVNGVGVTTLTSVETLLVEPTEFLLVTLVLGIEAVDIDCSGRFVGTVGPNGEDEITELLDLAGVNKISNNLVGTGLDCLLLNTIGGSGCNVNELVEFWPDNLPWHTNLFLMESGAFLDHIFGGGTEPTEPGYHVICATTGTENLCLGLSSTTMTNVAGGVLGKFDATSEKAKCTTGEGDLTAEGVTKTLTGTLTVSSE